MWEGDISFLDSAKMKQAGSCTPAINHRTVEGLKNNVVKRKRKTAVVFRRCAPAALQRSLLRVNTLSPVDDDAERVYWRN
ncbi:hypothetical protein M514_06900 [Trichuris suis]|uniref:Uncharacterized protein n=1 Tax=Trichuris suis TaxID=68888 RepID=A0A085M4P1_9BILA|nr:hypothetical protein M513_06900 [Trichuris suis]KFD70372.1 hypothetical protein M514_06900 [Trichuris suis]